MGLPCKFFPLSSGQPHVNKHLIIPPFFCLTVGRIHNWRRVRNPIKINLRPNSAVLEARSMLHLAAAGLLINLERRGLKEIFSEHERNLWKIWQPKGLVIASLVLQIALILSGKRRKYTGGIWFRFFVWSTYLLAEWVATLALGVIANNIQETSTPNKQGHGHDDLRSFWAPFLLVHLGGPDTITAYSMEDNELWQRRALKLLTQTAASLYIFLIAWPGISWFPCILIIPMLAVGIVKYGETIASLRSASSEHFRDSLLTPPDPGPNYAKFMEDFTLKKAEGFYVKAGEAIDEASVPTNSPVDAENAEGFYVKAGEAIDEASVPTNSPVDAENAEGFYVKAGEAIDVASVPTNSPVDAADDESQLILQAYNQFQRFKRLFVDLILSFQDRDESLSLFKKLGSKKAFHVIEIELGFIYDVLYTKAHVVYSITGCFLRFLTILLTSVVLVLFPFMSKGNKYQTVDLVITYLLMGGAIALEIGALLFLLFSDRTHYGLSKHSHEKRYRFLKQLISWRNPGKRWSNSMAQYSLVDVCLEEEEGDWLPKIMKKLVAVNKALEAHMCLTHTDVSPDLKDLIFSHCLDISKKIRNSKELMNLCRSRGDYALNKYKLIKLDWSTTKVEFDQSILLWHIATELCYHYDGISDWDTTIECKESKHISDYMLYLLAMCPFMLPVGIGLIRFRDTCAEAKDFFKNKKPINSKAMACRMLLRVNTEVEPSKVKGDRSKSVLFDACRLANSLRGPEDPTGRDRSHKWKIISKVWVEILGYAAIHCRGAQHAQQLRKGGELLTHVWLLMAHLGITEQLQISQGHARAKLNVK